MTVDLCSLSIFVPSNHGRFWDLHRVDFRFSFCWGKFDWPGYFISGVISQGISHVEGLLWKFGRVLNLPFSERGDVVGSV